MDRREPFPGKQSRLTCLSWLALGSFITLACVASAQADPALIGVWLASTPAPDKSYTENVLWQLYPSGDFGEHWQHTKPGEAIVVNGESADVASYLTHLDAAKGRLKSTSSDGSSRGASYVLCPDNKKLLVKWDDQNFTFLFVKFGDIQDDHAWTTHIDDNGPLFNDTDWSKTRGNGFSLRLGLGGVAHWVDPACVGLWSASLPSPAGGPLKTFLWEVHPDGQSTLHIREGPPVQPLTSGDPNRDAQTIPGTLDAFGGRFLFASKGGSSKETGTYKVAKSTVEIVFEQSGKSYVFTRCGDIPRDGSIQK